MRTLRQWLLAVCMCLLASDFTWAKGVGIEGELTVLYADDFVNHRAEAIYLLQQATTGKTMRLRARDERTLPKLQSGSRVRVNGRVEANGEFTLAANDASASIQVLEAASVQVTGERRTVVVLVDFLNAGTDCSPALVSNLVFGATGSVNSLFQQTSGGAAWFSGDVIGPVTINYNSNGACDPHGWANAADAAVTAAGVDLSTYQHKVYVLPKRNPCSWPGLGTVGGNPSRAWIGICDMVDLYAHELGHNLGMHHAATDADNDGTADCEYCDNSDVMGYSGVGLRGLNAPHLEALGWLAPGKLAVPVTEGVVQLAPVGGDPRITPYPQVIKIPRPGTQDHYYFSYRRSLGYDVNLGETYRDKTSVHYFAGGKARTHLVATLADSRSFTDPTSGLTIRQLAHNSEFATLQIGFSCTRSVPAVSLTPANASIPPGATGNFSLLVTNLDSVACADSTFHIIATIPGLLSTTVPAQLALMPGAVGQAQIQVHVPGGALPGTYPLVVQVSDNFELAHAVTVTASCVVASALVAPDDNLAPSAPANLTAAGSPRRVTLRWTGSTDNLGVSGYWIYRDGVLLGQSRRPRFADRKVVAGATHSYFVTAVDGSGNESAPSNVAEATAAKPVR